MRKPFFRRSVECWYVKDEAGRFIRLDPNKTKAFDLWREMLANGDRSPSRISVAVLLDDYLAEHENQISKERFSKFQFFANDFVAFVGGSTKAIEVSNGKVIEWLQKPRIKRKDVEELQAWSSTRQADAGSMLKSMFRWGEDTGLIGKSPLRRLKLPSRSNRVSVIPAEVHKALVTESMKSTRSRSFALYLIASQCGARPQQIRDVTALNVSDDCSTMVFFKHKNFYKTTKPLIVFASPCLQTILKILVAARPNGPLFLNDRGTPWGKDTVCRRLARLREKLGIDHSVIAYAYRHTFATDALRAGIDTATVAALLGHSSIAMVSKVYGHLSEHPEHIKAAAARAAKLRIVGE